MTRAARAAWWISPSILCLAIYWLGLKAWFQQDDFAWLGLNIRLRETGDLWTILFAPMAQGTIRPLSERVFFMVFYALFGLNALPYRLAVFLTQFASLALVASITRRLTGSRTAGFFAPVFWIANSALAVAMSWTSAYNQALCAFFLLLSFHLLLRHIETGKRSYLIWQWITFLTGFGVLEVNIVYPVLAATYTLCCARRHFRKTLWLFLPSAVYAVLHWKFAPKAATGLYAMHFDGSVVSTLWTYWAWALGPERLSLANIELAPWVVPAATAVLSLAILGFTIWKLWRREWLAAFLIVWFLVLIGPVLPLRDHVSDYYLTLPLIGLAMLGGWAFASAWRGHWTGTTAAVLAAAIYLASCLPSARAATRWNYERSHEVKNLVRGLARARELHPGKIILLTGVGTDLFWAGIYDKPYRLLGIREVYLAPGSEGNIEAYAELGSVSDYVLPGAPALRALEENRAVVYSVGGERLRNVTSVYRAVARSRWSASEEPRRVDVGDPLFAGQVGPAWHQVEGSFRWMPKRATVRLGGPRSAGEKLHLSGFLPARQVEQGPLKMTVSVDGHTLPPVLLRQGDASFEVSFPLPAELIGKERVEVSVEVDRTFVVPSDGRSLGLVFGAFAIR